MGLGKKYDGSGSKSNAPLVIDEEEEDTVKGKGVWEDVSRRMTQ